MKKILFFLIFVLCASLVIAVDDFDSDGMPDEWEKKYNLNYDVNDANLDPDNDGLTNYQEYIQQSNPLVAEKDSNLLTSIFTFLSTNIIQILLGIAVLVIIYFGIKVIIEVSRLGKMKESKKKIIPRQINIPIRQQTIQKTQPRPRFNSNKLNNFKRKHKKINHLTYNFEEKKEIDDLSPLSFSFSGRIRKLKKSLKSKPEVKEEEPKGSVFDRLPKRK